MKNLGSNFRKDIAIVLIVVVIITVTSLISIISRPQNDSIKGAEVVSLLELVQDGGFFYQNVEAKLDGEDKLVNLRIQIKDLKLEEVKVGDRIYVQESDSSLGEIFSFIGHNRSTILFWITIIFFSIMVVILGAEGFQYIIPTILIFILVFSGALAQLIGMINIYVATFLVLGLIAFVSILVQVRNVRLALVVSISQFFTLLIVLLINLILYKTAFLTEIYYTNLVFLESEVTLVEFWTIINAAVLYVAFGASITTTLDVAMSIMKKKRAYPTTSTVNLIREGTSHNQLANARVINSLFFVFLGVTFVYILTASKNLIIPFWDDPYVVQGLIIFVNAAIAALLVGPITAVITAVSLNAEEKKTLQLRLKRPLKASKKQEATKT